MLRWRQRIAQLLWTPCLPAGNAAVQAAAGGNAGGARLPGSHRRVPRRPARRPGARPARPARRHEAAGCAAGPQPGGCGGGQGRRRRTLQRRRGSPVCRGGGAPPVPLARAGGGARGGAAAGACSDHPAVRVLLGAAACRGSLFGGCSFLQSAAARQPHHLPALLGSPAELDNAVTRVLAPPPPVYLCPGPSYSCKGGRWW